MEPGVPFALLGAVELLTVAAWIVLAVAGIGLSRGAVVARVLAPLMTGALPPSPSPPAPASCSARPPRMC